MIWPMFGMSIPKKLRSENSHQLLPVYWSHVSLEGKTRWALPIVAWSRPSKLRMLVEVLAWQEWEQQQDERRTYLARKGDKQAMWTASDLWISSFRIKVQNSGWVVLVLFFGYPNSSKTTFFFSLFSGSWFWISGYLQSSFCHRYSWGLPRSELLAISHTCRALCSLTFMQCLQLPSMFLAVTTATGKTDWICSGTIGHSQLVEAIFADVFTKVGSLAWYPIWTCLGSQIPRFLSICPSRTWLKTEMVADFGRGRPPCRNRAMPAMLPQRTLAVAVAVLLPSHVQFGIPLRNQILINVH